MNNEIVRLMHFLEFSDSAFPVGTFSFSNGLESAAFEGIVHDVPTLEAYTRTAVMQTVHSDAIAALIAFRAIGDNDYELVKEADAQVMQCKMNTEARLMLTRMGKKMAEIGSRIANCPVMDRWLEDIRNQRVAGTYPISPSYIFPTKRIKRTGTFCNNRIRNYQHDRECSTEMYQGVALRDPSNPISVKHKSNRRLREG